MKEIRKRRESQYAIHLQVALHIGGDAGSNDGDDFPRRLLLLERVGPNDGAHGVNVVRRQRHERFRLNHRRRRHLLISVSFLLFHRWLKKQGTRGSRDNAPCPLE